MTLPILSFSTNYSELVIVLSVWTCDEERQQSGIRRYLWAGVGRSCVVRGFIATLADIPHICDVRDNGVILQTTIGYCVSVMLREAAVSFTLRLPPFDINQSRRMGATSPALLSMAH